jgi:DNA-3-methyladenine glycosylase
MNVVTEREGHASAVLLRALEPVENLEGSTRGPGLLCRAMQITKLLNGHDLLSDDFFIAAPTTADRCAIVKRPRVGVDYAGRWAKRHLRFYLKRAGRLDADSDHVPNSRSQTLNTAPKFPTPCR